MVQKEGVSQVCRGLLALTMAQGVAHRQCHSPSHRLSQPSHRMNTKLDLEKGGGGWRDGGAGLSQGKRLLAWYSLLSAVYLYLFCLAGRRINYALKNVESKFDVARTIGGALMCLTVPLATYQIVLHLCNFVEPRQQSQIVRIVFMVPMYSVTAFLSLRFVHWSLFITTVRECYEAYVIYCFLHFLVGTLGDDLPATNSRLAAMPPVVGRHTRPFCCLQPWQMGREFLQRCQAGVFQYVLIRLASTAVALGLQLSHLYREGDFDPKRGYLWITVVTCVSQSWALYVLVLFYRATHKEMSHIHPLGKFLTIKTIVFFSWWQGILIEFLEGRGHFSSVVGASSAEGRDPSEHVAQGIQDLLICLEMLVAAVFFFYAFPLSDYLRIPREEIEHQSNHHLLQPTRSFHAHEQAVSGDGASQGGRAEGKSTRIGLMDDSSSRAVNMTSEKSHHRLDLITQVARPSKQMRLPAWEALRQSVLPMELRVDLRETRDTVNAQHRRLREHLAFLTKQKVEARQGIGGIGGSVGRNGGVGLGVGRVMTL